MIGEKEGLLAGWSLSDSQLQRLLDILGIDKGDIHPLFGNNAFFCAHQLDSQYRHFDAHDQEYSAPY